MAALQGLIGGVRRWVAPRRGRTALGAIIERLEQRSMLSGVEPDSDGGGSALESLVPLDESSAISILNTNRPPSLLLAASPSLVPVAAAVVVPTNGSTSGSTLVAALVDAGGPLGNFTDPDFDLPGIAVTGLNLQGGRLWFSVNDGMSWQEITQASPTSATLLHADDQTRLFFSPATGFQGTLSDVLTFRAWDRTGRDSNGSSGINTQHLLAVAGATLATGSASETVATSPDGRYAFIVDHSAGLVIVDVGNPLSPVKVGAYKGTGEYRGVAISEDGRYAYFATGSTGLQVIDISTPSKPVRVGGFNTAGFATFVTLSKDARYAYVADGDAGLRILDVSNPHSPKNVGGVATVDWARGVAVSADGQYAYVSDWVAGMKVIDIRNPAQPVQVAAFGTAGYADGVVMLPGDRHVLVAAHTAGLQIVDVSNPAVPVAAGRSDTLYTARRVAVSSDGRSAFVADGRGGVTLVDVGTPSSPVSLSHVATLGSAESVAVSADGRHLFVAIAAGGFQTITVSADPSPFSLTSDAVSVDVGPENAAPSGITLTSATIRENSPVTTRVGTLTASDPDYGDTFAFKLVSGDGSVDNASFEIVGNEVRSAANFNFEAKSQYSIRIRATDQGGLFIEKSFVVSITDANDAPVLSLEASPSLAPVAAAVTSPANGSISGSTLVSELVDTGGRHGNFSDADGNLPGIAIVGLNLQGGRLWFSVNGGTSWSEINQASPDAATLLHADNLTRLFFSPAPGFQGSLPEVITFRAWDRTGGHLNGATGVNTQPLLGPEAGVLATGAWADLVVTSRDGRYAFMVDGSSKLTIVDISNPTSPVEVGQYSGLGGFRSVAVASNGRFAFLANGNAGLQVLDIADPSRPVKVATAKTLGFATNVTLSPDERFAFVADGHAGLRIVDISVPTAPRLLGGAEISDWARSVVVSPDAFYAYVADWTTGLKIFDVRDRDRPTLVASFGTAGYVDGLALAADGRHLFAAVHSAGLQVIDVTNPAAPVSVGRTATFDAAQRLTLSTDGRYALVADQRAGLTAIDISNPSAPSRLGSFATPGIASGVAVTPDGRHVFVADGGGSLRAVPISVEANAFSASSDVASVSIGFANSRPTNVALTRSTVAENQPVGTKIGTLSTADPDAGDTFSYTLVSGSGSSDNASFAIVGNELQTAVSFDYEVRSSYSIRVRSTDAGGLFAEKAFTISIADFPEEWSLEQGLGEVVVDTVSRTGSSRLVKRGAGALILNQANTHSGGTIIEAGELVIRHPAALGTGVLQVLPGAKVTLDVGTQQVPVSRLALSSSAVLDVATGSMLLAPGDYDFATVRGLITSARTNGTWAGSGIRSSSVQPGTLREVGYRVLADGSLLVGYSAVGDANMDGSVNIQDLILISSSGRYGSGAADSAWWQGDFNYDGVVNITDLVSLSASGLYGAGSYLPATVPAATSLWMSEVPANDVMSGLTVTPTGHAPAGGIEPSVARSEDAVAVQTTSHTSLAKVFGRSSIGRLAWAAIASQGGFDAPKDGKSAQWRPLVG